MTLLPPRVLNLSPDEPAPNLLDLTPKGLLHERVTVSVTRPDGPVWS